MMSKLNMKVSDKRILMIDNYDSFTYNLYDYLLQIGLDVDVFRNDEFDLAQINIGDYHGVVLSPGPGRPEDAGQMMELIEKYVHQIPMFGVCLGYQALGMFFGARLSHALLPIHGKVAHITHQGDSFFCDLSQPLQVMRYHSLILKDLPKTLRPLAVTNESELMAFTHESLPVGGVQFHPESIQTPEGLNLLKNWMQQFLL